MKHKFRIIIGMLLLAIPLCMNAQVQPTKPNQDPEKAKVEAKKNAEKDQAKKEKAEKKAQLKQEKADKKDAAKKEAEKKDALLKKDGEKKEPKDGKMPKISGFVQGMYQANLSDKGKLIDNTFRMRRVRLSVDGNLSNTVSYKIQGDFSRSPMLVDAYFKYKPCREFAIQVGQFKTPFTLESPINPVNLEIFDYGESVQQLVGYNDICGVGALGRDMGIMATGSFFHIMGEEGYKYSIVDYAIGVFNGNGPATIDNKGKDNNNRKDIVGRLEVHPGLKALTLSGSFYYGQYKNADDQGVRNRWTAGAQYNDGKLVLRGEYISGKTGYTTDLPEDLGYFNSNGYYAQAGYYFKAGEQKIMPVLRYEHFTKDAGIVDGGTNWYTAGINYWPLKSVNFKLDYSLVQKESGTNSHRVVGILSYKF